MIRWDTRTSQKLCEQLERYGQHVKHFDCDLRLVFNQNMSESASPQLALDRVIDCMKRCPNLLELSLRYSGWEEFSPEPLFGYLTLQVAPRRQRVTLSIFSVNSTLAPLLENFLAACAGLHTLHLYLGISEVSPGLFDPVALRIRQLPLLQVVAVPSFGFIRPSVATVSNPLFSRLRVCSVLGCEDLEYIQREFGGTLEHLQVDGFQLPEHHHRVFSFPRLSSLRIQRGQPESATPFTSIFDPNMPLKVLKLETMTENLFQSIQEFVQVQLMPTLSRIVVHNADVQDSGNNGTDPSLSEDSFRRQWRKIYGRTLRCWLWARPLGIEVVQNWVDWAGLARWASEDESLSTLLKALKVEDAAEPDPERWAGEDERET